MSTAVEARTTGPSTLVRRVAVIGGGTMGNGIAQAFATSGFDVELVDVKPELLAGALETIRKNVDRVAQKQGWPGERAPAVLARIHGGVELEAARDCQVVVEAVSEDFALKRRVFESLDRLTPAETVLATNTFMNPVPVMQLVEIIRGLATSDATCALAEDLARRLGKTPVEVNDYPGFVSNRVLMPMINEAVYCLMEGVASREAIDTVMKLGMNHPMGPLALADLIGLDTCLSIMEVLHQGLGDSKYRPCPLLRKMVKAGYLGRKSGRGFYEYGTERGSS